MEGASLEEEEEPSSASDFTAWRESCLKVRGFEEDALKVVIESIKEAMDAERSEEEAASKKAEEEEEEGRIPASSSDI